MSSGQSLGHVLCMPQKRGTWLCHGSAASSATNGPGKIFFIGCEALTGVEDSEPLFWLPGQPVCS